MATDKEKPATKGDVRKLDGKTDRLERKTDRLERKIDQVDAKVDRLAIEVVKANTSLRSELTGGMDRLRTELTARLEGVAARMETIWRESALMPRVADEHAKTLADHERRISRLESAG